VRVTPLLIVAAVALAGATAPAAASAAPPVSEAEAQRADRVVGEALAKSYDPIEQSRNLVALAWPDGKRDEVVAARARRELGDFGGHGMVALREAINTVKPAYAAGSRPHDSHRRRIHARRTEPRIHPGAPGCAVGEQS
jgi:hypothetical protein